MSDILGMLRTTTQLNQIAEEHFDIAGAKFKRNFRVKDVRIRNSKTYAERGATMWVLLAMRKDEIVISFTKCPKGAHLSHCGIV